MDETEEAVRVAEKALGEAPRKHWVYIYIYLAVVCCGHAIHSQTLRLEQQ